ncbi:yop-1 [Symbiodinium natans]|uniref:Yop-1 protein n=1 Tax=Symbiodinium natans TaxID=878477 RepID=A0A812UF56_9DINO|nr:yop-1 [Symbiodinium natans]
MIPYIGVANFAVQYCYPGYETVRLLIQDKPSSNLLTQWTFYWLICASFLQLESTLLALVVEYLPLYLEFKTLCLLWLVHPNYKGALWLWHGKLKEPYASVEHRIRQLQQPSGNDLVWMESHDCQKSCRASRARHELPSDGKSLLWLEAAVCREGASCQASVAAAQLCASTTREFLERLLAAKRWRALLEDGTGARLVAAMGMPMQELMGVLDCVQPPPGAEMPVALAQLLRRTSPQNPENPENPASPFESMHAVVDAGAPALAVQLQSVPPAVAEGLGGVLRLQDLVRAAKQAAVPSAVTSGLQMLIGASADDREDWRDAFKATVTGLRQLRQDMAALAEADTGVLLVVHWPGPGERAAQRLVDRLSPICAVLIGFPDNIVPPWLSGIPTVSLPAMEERSPGLGELRKLAEAMLRA